MSLFLQEITIFRRADKARRAAVAGEKRQTHHSMQHHKEAAPPPSLKPSEDNSDSQWWRHPPHPIIPWSQGLRDYHCNICKFTMCLNNISFHTSRFCLLAVLVLLVLSLTKISGCFYFEYFNSNLKPDACLKTNLYGNLWILNAI